MVRHEWTSQLRYELISNGGRFFSSISIASQSYQLTFSFPILNFSPWTLAFLAVKQSVSANSSTVNFPNTFCSNVSISTSLNCSPSLWPSRHGIANYKGLLWNFWPTMRLLFTPSTISDQKDPFMQNCLRELWLCLAIYNVSLHARYVESSSNYFADALSRFHLGASSAARVASIAAGFRKIALSDSIFHFQLPKAIFISCLFSSLGRWALSARVLSIQAPDVRLPGPNQENNAYLSSRFSLILFCTHFNFLFYPVTKATYLAYLAFLSQSLKSFTSVKNYLSILSHWVSISL